MTKINSVVTLPLKEQPTKETQTNYQRLSFKNNNSDSFVRQEKTPVITQPPMFVDQQARMAKMLEQQQKEQKKQKVKSNLVTGISVAASLVMLAYFGKLMIKDLKLERAQKKLEATFAETTEKGANKVAKTFSELLEANMLEEAVAKCPDAEIRKIAQAEIMGGHQGIGYNKLRVKQLLTEALLREQKPETFDIHSILENLDKYLIGMEEVKEPIIKALVERNQLIRQGKSPKKPVVILLHSKPGQGKTTVVRRTAEGAKKPFGSLSCAGIDDPAVLIGDRSGYIGAQSGKIATIHYNNKSKQNFILLDEIDKTSKGLKGDPISTMLQMFDDRAVIEDQFLGIPIDISQDIFILTANDISKLPDYFINRLKPIYIEPYENSVKSKIAKINFDRIVNDHGLNIGKVEDGVFDMIASSTHDAGGRETVAKIEDLVSELTTQVELGENKGKPLEVTKELTENLLNNTLKSIKERFRSSVAKNNAN